MAYKRSKGKLARRKKIELAVQTIYVNTPVTSVNVDDPNFKTSTSFLDLSQIACLLNRRFYRQGINWAVSGFKVLSGVTGTVAISKLPNTWVMSNAWEKSFRSWQEMNKEAMEESPSVRPRFMDFKIYADADHHALGFGANLLPKSTTDAITFTQAVPGEWESSKIAIPTSLALGDATDFEVLAVGPSYPGAGASTLDAVSCIEGYAASRGLPNVLDPNTPADAEDVGPTATPENWMGALKNEGTEQDQDVLDRLSGVNAENSIAPYPFENDGVSIDTMYPNGANQLTGLELHDVSNITGTTVGGITRIKGGMFPCGLIRIDHVQPATETVANLAILIDLVPGNHRGYMCEPMTEM